MRQRRNFSSEFKAKVVLEIISGTKNAAEICREHNLKPDLLSHRKNRFLANASNAFASAWQKSVNQPRMVIPNA